MSTQELNCVGQTVVVVKKMIKEYFLLFFFFFFYYYTNRHDAIPSKPTDVQHFSPLYHSYQTDDNPFSFTLAV